MKDTLMLRGCKLLLLAAVVWFMLGAPILPEEWQDIPQRISVMAAQLPTRMQRIIRLWR